MRRLKNYKVGLDSETYAISLVSEPAIEEELVYMNEDKADVKLSSDEKHMVFSAVLVPDRPIYRNNGEQEFYVTFTKESIEKMSQDYLKEYRQKNITLEHEEDCPEVTLVESWLKSDLALDKSVALGLNPELPVGTWFAGMKINNVEAWDKIKSGELKGFSVESLISLEDFTKAEEEDLSMGLMNKIKEYVSGLFKSFKEEEFEAEPEPTPEPQPEPVEPAPVEPEPEPEPTPAPVEPEPDEPKSMNLDELNQTIGNLLKEVEALKSINEGLRTKVDELSKLPSAEPFKPNAKPTAQNTYTAWRDQMARML